MIRSKQRGRGETNRANCHAGTEASPRGSVDALDMKAPLSLLFLLLASNAFAAIEFSIPTPAPASDEALLAAIAEVETSNNPRKVGTHGERTHLQIAPATWVRFSRLPHSASASHLQETDRVARAYLASIRSRLKSRGLPETPFFIAAAWNVGPGWKVLPSSTVSYAERVANLVQAAQATPEIPQAPKSVVPTIVVREAGASESPPADTIVVTVPTLRPFFRVANLN